MTRHRYIDSILPGSLSFSDLEPRWPIRVGFLLFSYLLCSTCPVPFSSYSDCKQLSYATYHIFYLFHFSVVDIFPIKSSFLLTVNLLVLFLLGYLFIVFTAWLFPLKCKSSSGGEDLFSCIFLSIDSLLAKFIDRWVNMKIVFVIYTAIQLRDIKDIGYQFWFTVSLPLVSHSSLLWAMVLVLSGQLMEATFSAKHQLHSACYVLAETYLLQSQNI